MLKCIAIDDEPLALRQLQGYIAKINFLKLEKAFTNAIEAQQYLAGRRHLKSTDHSQDRRLATPGRT